MARSKNKTGQIKKHKGVAEILLLTAKKEELNTKMFLVINQ